MPKKRVFLSAVSSEFAHARQALANHLIALGFDPVWQDAFPDHGNAPSLQRKLYDLVASCDAMICLVGRRSGSYPPPDAATPFAAMLPEDFAEASRTQWEFFFARALGKPWRLFRAHKDWTPDDPAPPIDDRSDRQTAFLAWMDRPDLPWVEFRSSDHLNAEAGKINWDAGPPLRPPREKPIALPYQSLGTLFKGRDQFLRDLRASLLEKTGATAIVSNALLGMGGIGKTRAAVEYAWAYKESYTALLFVQADSPQNLKTNLAALSGPLLLPEQAGRDEDARYHAVLAWLRANPVWLLILDNVDTDAAREAALTILGSLTGGHVVLTSRLDAGAWHEVTPLDLDLLDAGAAVEFLMDATATQRLRRDDDPARAEALATELGRLVLALDLAAATIRQRKCSFADYLVLWHESRDLVTVSYTHLDVYKRQRQSVARPARRVERTGNLSDHLLFGCHAPIRSDHRRAAAPHDGQRGSGDRKSASVETRCDRNEAGAAAWRNWPHGHTVEPLLGGEETHRRRHQHLDDRTAVRTCFRRGRDRRQGLRCRRRRVHDVHCPAGTADRGDPRPERPGRHRQRRPLHTDRRGIVDGLMARPPITRSAGKPRTRLSPPDSKP